MLILVVILIFLVIALLRGGRFERLGEVPLRWTPLFLLGFLIQLFIFTPLLGPHLTPSQTAVAYSLSMILIWGTLLLNWKIPGVPWMALGVFLNWLVIVLNGGFMPASIEALQLAGLHDLAAMTDGQHHNNSILVNQQTRLPWLADVMAVPDFVPLSNVFSVGDVLLAIGAGWFLQHALLSGQKDPEPTADVNSFSTPT